MQCRIDSGSGYGSWTNITNSNYQIFRMPGENNTLSSTKPGYSSEFIKTIYGYYMYDYITQVAKDGKKISDLILKGTGDSDQRQYLASKEISCYTFASAYVGFIDYSGCISFSRVYRSDGYCTTEEYGGRVRPIVTLKSDVKL